MQLPTSEPARPRTEFLHASLVNGARDCVPDESPLEPAACCAEACVNIPFVGRVCHCVLDLPICP